MKNLLLMMVTILLGSSLSVSCVSLKSHLKYTHRTKSVVPIDAFAYVEVSQVAKPSKCQPSEKFEECKKIINHLPPHSRMGTGSGLLVWTKNKPVFLTAAHVCVDDFPDVYEHQGVKFTIEKKIDIKVRSHEGEVYPTTILKLDKGKDLCALEVSKMIAPPVKLSHRAPKIGDKVYALSAPYGINAKGMTLVFSGYYSGNDERWHYYTIPTRPGSSGSIVLNKDHQAVGMLNAAFLDIENVGLGAGYEDLKVFLKSID